MNEVSDHALQEAATELGMVLREQARRIATAESCTGGCGQDADGYGGQFRLLRGGSGDLQQCGQGEAYWRDPVVP